MLTSASISIGTYILYRAVLNFYNKYYIKSECHQRSIEISVVDTEQKEQKEQTETELPEIKNVVCNKDAI